MNIQKTTAVVITVVGTMCSASQARVIVEDFDDVGYNAELIFDFSSDFTGGGDTNDHSGGVLWLFADLADISVISLAPGEWIESVEVTWVDFCGVGCTAMELLGDSDNAIFDNSLVGDQETVLGTVADLGEPITHFTISSFEGRFEEIVVTVVPAPASTALIGFATLLMLPKRKR